MLLAAHEAYVVFQFQPYEATCARHRQDKLCSQVVGVVAADNLVGIGVKGRSMHHHHMILAGSIRLTVRVCGFMLRCDTGSCTHLHGELHTSIHGTQEGRTKGMFIAGNNGAAPGVGLGRTGAVGLHLSPSASCSV